MPALRVHHPGATPLNSLLQRCHDHVQQIIRQNRGEVARSVLLTPFSTRTQPALRGRSPRALVTYHRGTRSLLRPLCGANRAEGLFLVRALPGVSESAYVTHFFAKRIPLHSRDNPTENAHATLTPDADTTDSNAADTRERWCCVLVCRQEILVLEGVVMVSTGRDTAADTTERRVRLSLGPLHPVVALRLALRVGQRQQASLVGAQCDRDVVNLCELQPGDNVWDTWCLTHHRFRLPSFPGQSAVNLVGIIRGVQQSTQLVERLLLQSGTS